MSLSGDETDGMGRVMPAPLNLTNLTEVELWRRLML
jgi:hypothetical protein